MTHPPYLLKSIGVDIGDTGPYLLGIGSIPKYAVSHTTTIGYNLFVVLMILKQLEPVYLMHLFYLIYAYK